MEPIFLQRCVLNIIKFENLKKTVCILFFMIVLNDNHNRSLFPDAPLFCDVCTKIVCYIF